jgi:O-antigen biosynthesis protein
MHGFRLETVRRESSLAPWSRGRGLRRPRGEAQVEGASGPGAHSDFSRPEAHGKFLRVGGERFWIRGVTYGPFHPDSGGGEYGSATTVERDFAQIATGGFNAIRTYTVPPRSLLDAAQRHGLRVMVGIPWEQHVAFLDERARPRSIEERVRAGVRACAGHPAVLSYAIGSEIPAPIVRWHGRARVEQHLERLYRAAKSEDPGGLVTYVNYPTTEYLDLPFLDLVCFNVYLESQDRLEAYLARLQNLAGDRPLVLAEVGLDSRRHGEESQARMLDWQIRTAFAAGCAGALVFAWTDQWHRGGYDITDWAFGLTNRARRPKPALEAARTAFAEAPFPKDGPWPRISVVVCSYNGARTIGECMEGLLRLEYPDYEVIVVSDGSRDHTAAIAEKYGFRVIKTENRGLSSARNTGWKAAKGEIVAYIDDDAYPDPNWLTYVAHTFRSNGHAGVGGPNLPPPGDGPLAECVANAPGGPVQVLLSDREAEHIPGCNMAFRKAVLAEIGGFDPRFRAAGDDVDICWRILERGWTIGFNPGAVVWHHRRDSVRAYLKQQSGYGRAEALLERKWPEKYNGAGHPSWTGRLYGSGLAWALRRARGRIYHGTWGSALFQSVYEPAPGTFTSLFLMPEWYLVIGGLAVLSALGALWPPLLVALPLLAGAASGPVMLAVLGARRARFARRPGSRLQTWKLRTITALLHLLQPGARLWGRIRYGLTPWRGWSGTDLTPPWPRTRMVWSERGHAPDVWLRRLEAELQATFARVCPGGDFDRWDLEVRRGLFGGARVLMAIEEHGEGRQLVRFRVWPTVAPLAPVLVAVVTALAWGAARDGIWAVTVLLTAGGVLTALSALRDCAAAMGTVMRALPWE